MKRNFRTALLFILSILLIFTSCNNELRKVEEGSVNEYIYPYLKFTETGDGETCTAIVVEGARLHKVRVPEYNGSLKVTEFLGFENPEDAVLLKELELEGNETLVSPEALENSPLLEDIKVIETDKDEKVWGSFPVLEKEGYEFLGWYAGDIPIVEGMPIDPDNSVAVPLWRAHRYVEHEGKAPTCTTPGWRPYKTCLDCDYTTFEEIPALGHEFVHVDRVEPTCTTDGNIEYYVCSRCGWLFSEADPDTRIDSVTLPMRGHDLKHYPAKEPTCTGIGYDEFWQCQNKECRKYFVKDPDGSLREVEFSEITKEPIEHSWKTEWSFDRNEHWHECSVCGERCDVEKHIWENPEVIQNPTETVPGKVRYTCRCGAEDVRTIEPENHRFVKIEGSYKAPSCTEDGYQDYICEDCGLTYREVLKALGHTPEKIEYVPATCQTTGMRAHWYCAKCDRHYSTSDCTEEIDYIIPKTEHKFEGEFHSNEEGHYQMCSYGCGTRSEIVPHKFDREIATTEYIYKAATCTEPAVYWKSCECGYKSSTDKFEYGEPAGHNMTRHETATAKPCAPDGHVEYWYCDRCGKYFADAEGKTELISLRAEHVQDGWDTTKEGFHRPYCKNCHEGYGEWEKHDASGWYSNATSHWKECTVCGQVLVKEPHTFEIRDGKKVCSVCGFVEEENITGGDFDVSTEMKLPKGTLLAEIEGNTLHVEFRNSNADYPPVSYQWYVMDELVETNDTGRFSCDVSSPRNYRIMCLFSNEWGKNSESINVVGGSH